MVVVALHCGWWLLYMVVVALHRGGCGCSSWCSSMRVVDGCWCGAAVNAGVVLFGAAVQCWFGGGRKIWWPGASTGLLWWMEFSSWSPFLHFHCWPVIWIVVVLLQPKNQVDGKCVNGILEKVWVGGSKGVSSFRLIDCFLTLARFLYFLFLAFCLRQKILFKYLTLFLFYFSFFSFYSFPSIFSFLFESHRFTRKFFRSIITRFFLIFLKILENFFYNLMFSTIEFIKRHKRKIAAGTVAAVATCYGAKRLLETSTFNDFVRQPFSLLQNNEDKRTDECLDEERHNLMIELNQQACDKFHKVLLKIEVQLKAKLDNTFDTDSLLEQLSTPEIDSKRKIELWERLKVYYYFLVGFGFCGRWGRLRS
ncbi:unnamed protein product [Meloidogyne enterolobii]|uniref:Uncharacterized protein n=1 Tax=Meloidogyne enterolobii TaxID=390850 RepID=A0ACB1AJM9_MELEN